MSPRICYEPCNFRPKTLVMIDHANAIIDEYQQQGYDLTLRQLYYQFVSRDIIPNSQREYSRLGVVVSKARRAGLIDWDAITDRTRHLQRLATWDSPADLIQEDSECFRLDRWANQPYYVEVWFEKDALMGVFEVACQPLHVPYFSCRGFTSDSEMWRAAQRMERIASDRGQEVVVLHFGDHDPSGVDMTRDIEARLQLFGGPNLEVRRLALNMDQVLKYKPPPNPAKETDSRFRSYARRFGRKSWELDALDPATLGKLVQREIAGLLHQPAWERSKQEEALGRAQLQRISADYDKVVRRFKDLDVSEVEDVE